MPDCFTDREAHTKINEIAERVSAIESTVNVYLVPTTRQIFEEIACFREELKNETQSRITITSRTEGRFDITSIFTGAAVTALFAIVVYALTM